MHKHIPIKMIQIGFESNDEIEVCKICGKVMDMSKFKTILNGKWVGYYDMFDQYIKDLEQGYLEQQDTFDIMPGFPKLDIDPMNIYDNADNDEKRLIFGLLMIYYTEALRHWLIDKCDLWKPDRAKKHQEFVEKWSKLPLNNQIKEFWNK